MKPLAKLNAFHERLLDWCVANPHLTLRHAAAEFGYSVAWLCTVINSAMFQTRLRERQREISGRIDATIPEKLQALAHVSIDKLTDIVEQSDEPRLIKETADMVLHRLGYAPTRTAPAPTTIVQNTYVVSKDDLANCRAAIIDTSST